MAQPVAWAGTAERAAPWVPRIAVAQFSARRVRLVTGLVLFTYVGTHLLNHSLGNVSVPAMEAGLLVQKFLWQGAVGTVALYASAVTHLSLGLWAFYERRHFGWTRSEVVQLTLGLSIPLLLMNHMFGTRLSLAEFGLEKGYAQELYALWVATPYFGALQAVVLVVAWIHGCIGVHMWLRLKRGYARYAPVLVATAAVLPILALLGYFQGGRAVLAAVNDPAWRLANLDPRHVGTQAEAASLRAGRNWSIVAWVGAVGAVAAARLVRTWRERYGGTVRVTYSDGRAARVPRGFTILEASRAAGVPHASVCGGRGRCSTCRVCVVAGATSLPPARPAEQAVLDRVRAGPAVRLACQLRPVSDVGVVLLLPPQWTAATLRRRRPPRAGEERFIAVLVADMRGSTRLAETRLPFDAVFIIDRFVTAVGDAVVSAGGHVNNFTGDGLLASFGLDCGPGEACRRALLAVAAIGRNVTALNHVLAAEMTEPIGFGVGVHGGEVIVGEIGCTEPPVFTTLGDAANAATRLEAMCRELGCEAVVSDDVCRLGGLPVAGLALHEAALRGRAATLAVREVPRAAALQVG